MVNVRHILAVHRALVHTPSDPVRALDSRLFSDNSRTQMSERNEQMDIPSEEINSGGTAQPTQ